MKTVAYVYHTGRSVREADVATGDAPTEFFLGAIELEKAGYTVRRFELDVGNACSIWWSPMNWFAKRGWLPEKLNGGVLQCTGGILKELEGCDCVVATTSGLGFALGLWRAFGRCRVPIVAIHCGLINRPCVGLRRRLTGWLLRQMETVLYGDGEAAPLRELFPDVSENIRVVQFGVDHRFWTAGEGDRPGPVLSIGNDGRRDFDTVIRAFKGLDSPLQVVTRRNLPDLPSNVTHTQGSWHSPALSDAELREVYRTARCVVVGLHDSWQPSGQSVALQAMSCGCPVVLTRTRGLWSESMMRDGENVLLVDIGSVEGIRAAVDSLDKDRIDHLSRNGRDTVVTQASIDTFAKGIESVVSDLCAAGSGS